MDELSPGMLAAVIAVAGGAGAVLRFLLDASVSRWVVSRRARADRGLALLPVGMLVVNLSGSLVIGVLAGAVMHTGALWEVLSVGVLGGYTTFSAASLGAVQLLRERRFALACTVALGQMIAAGAVAGLGLWVGRLLAV